MSKIDHRNQVEISTIVEECLAVIGATLRKRGFRGPITADLIQGSFVRILSAVQRESITTKQQILSRARSAALDEIRKYCRSERLRREALPVDSSADPSLLPAAELHS